MNYKNMTTSEKKQFWKENPLHGNIEIRLPFMQSFLMYSQNDDTVVKELYWTNFTGWENTSLTLWYRLASRLNNECVLDIGSYSGIYSLIAKTAAANVLTIAYDIQKKCIDRIKMNAEINGFSNMHAVLSACSEKSGEIPFYFYEEEGILSSIASLVPNSLNDKISTVNSVSVDLHLEALKINTPVKLIKIDVEDAEIGAIAGLKNTILKYHPDMLVEINSKANIGKVVRLLPDTYNVFAVDDTHPRVKKLGFFFKRFEGHRNFLLTTKDTEEVNNLLSEVKIDTP